jgi:hypothetical protein
LGIGAVRTFKVISNQKAKEFLNEVQKLVDLSKIKKMELKYGNTKSYKYTLNDDLLNFITSKTFRSKNQTIFLFQLVDGDFEKLKQLEMTIKNCHTYTPGSKEDVEKVFKMKPKREWFKFD